MLGLFDGIGTGTYVAISLPLSTYTHTTLVTVLSFKLPPSLPPSPPPPLSGLLVLKELGFEVDRYVGSEIDPDAVKVSQVQHHDIIHVGNIERITEKQVSTTYTVVV